MMLAGTFYQRKGELSKSVVTIQSPVRKSCRKRNKTRDEVFVPEETLRGLQPRAYTCLPDSRAPRGKALGSSVFDRKRYANLS